MSMKREYDKHSKHRHTTMSKVNKTHYSFVRVGGSGENTEDNLNIGCKRTEIIRDGKKFPGFQKPCVVGAFSIDANRTFHPDESQLKYLHWSTSSDEPPLKRVHFDLNEGIKHCVRKDESINEKLDSMFEWIKTEINQNQQPVKADFVCYRGLLTTIMSTPYEQQDGWIICATQRNNIVFLCPFDTEKKKREKLNVSEKQKIFQSWGYKFEQFMLAEEPGQEPDTKSPVVETEELNCVFRSKLNNHSILYGAEMDGIHSDEIVSAKAAGVHFVELKTSRHIETQRQDRSFKRYKLLKWWCQSFLVGIETIYCGFRDDDGIVTTVKEFKVRELPKMAKGLWDPCVCMNFCAQFLDFVKGCLQDCSNQNALWKFEWTPHNSIIGREVDRNSEFSFVPNWYNL